MPLRQTEAANYQVISLHKNNMTSTNDATVLISLNEIVNIIIDAYSLGYTRGKKQMKKLVRILCLIMTAVLVLCSCSSSPKPEELPQIDENFEQGINCWYGINGADFDMEKAREYFRLSLESGNDKAL